MLNKYKIYIYLVGIFICFLCVGCGASIKDENQYVDTYDNVQGVAEQNAEIAANRYLEKSNQIYDKAMEEAMSGFYSEAKEYNEEDNFFERWTRTLVRMFYNRYGSLQAMAPGIAVLSIFVGGILFIFSTNNKPLRRFALYGLIIGVPIFLIILVYGVGAFSQVCY